MTGLLTVTSCCQHPGVDLFLPTSPSKDLAYCRGVTDKIPPCSLPTMLVTTCAGFILC